MTLLKLVFLEGQRANSFFKVHHSSTEALVAFKPRTEPELGTGDSHSTSTPPPPAGPKIALRFCMFVRAHLSSVQ